MMQTIQVGHFLIGVPGSGKSTLANQMAAHWQHTCIVSSDEIRERLFGAATDQRNWFAVRDAICEDIAQGLADGKTIIYDATNARRDWRIGILNIFQQRFPQLHWLGWWLQTPMELCQQWNTYRDRQVLPETIAAYQDYLHRYPPETGEGLAMVVKVFLHRSSDLTPKKSRKIDRLYLHTEHGLNLAPLEQAIASLPRSLTNRKTQEKKHKLHAYSALTDCDRLLFLIAEILRSPGLGGLSVNDPGKLQALLGTLTPFSTDTAEIAAVLGQRHGELYGDATAIAQDLAFLQNCGILSSPYADQPIILPPFTGDRERLNGHRYSDAEAFQRILTTLRFFIHYPHIAHTNYEAQGVQQFMITQLQKSGIHYSLATLRKDIEVLFIPYQLLPHPQHRKGYFVGTAIFRDYELRQIFSVLQSQSQSLKDPITLNTYETFRDRLRDSQILGKQDIADLYPVRAIANATIFDPEGISDASLYRNLPVLESAIINAELIRLRRFTNAAKFQKEPFQGEMLWVYPLQIVFHEIGWYLGYEITTGEHQGLISYLRLDRYAINAQSDQFRSPKEQREALEKLRLLTRHSYSLFLGHDPDQQKKFLTSPREASIDIELWCSDYIFRFISEGTQRYADVRMSEPPRGRAPYQSKTIFSLKGTGDKTYPYRWRGRFPAWVTEDVYLHRWLIGMGNLVKIMPPTPPAILEAITKSAKSIIDLYSSP